MRVTLKDLKKFAAQNKNRKFRTGDRDMCLISKYLREDKGQLIPEFKKNGQYLSRVVIEDKYEDNHRIETRNIRTPKNYDVGLEHIRNNFNRRQRFTGAQLEKFISRLMKGEKPTVAAEKTLTQTV